MPRWGRGGLCIYSLRQSDTLNSLRQYDTMIFFLYVFFWLSYFTKVKFYPYIYALIFEFVFIILVF